MLFQNLSPSPALSITQFSDIDAFRPVEFVADARSLPRCAGNGQIRHNSYSADGFRQT
jgi:AraC family ethanolamine operon transcriptional activator